MTVLFTDLVGSTEMRRLVGDDQADELRREHDDLVRQAIADHHGLEVKGTGDGLMVVFPAAAEAVGGGVDIQKAVHRFNLGSDPPMGVRVGLSAGDVAWEGDDCFGTPVVEARRLCDAAQEGQILASDIVRALAGSRGGHELVPVGELELKGLGAVAAWSVRWEPDAKQSFPFPPALTGEEQVALVGRELELEQLEVAWKESAGGATRLMLVSGEPGVGKTRLTSEAARVAHARGAIVLFGRCDEELGIPYQPFLEVISTYAARCPTEVLVQQVGSYAGELTRLVPALTDRLGVVPNSIRADPETERFRLFEAVGALLASIARSAPLVVVLDDLHWATKPTLLLLRHLVKQRTAVALFLIGTYRDTDLDRGHPLSEVLADLRRESGVDRVALHGLDRDGVAEFLRSAAGHDLDAEALRLAATVHEETEGNPFFVGQVLRHLVESGSIVNEDGRWVRAGDALGIPEGVREVIGKRLSQLGPETNEILAVAAVIGREFDARLLAEAADRPLEEVLDAIEEAEDRHLALSEADRPGRSAFTHALVRSTLYDEIPTTRRLRWHRSVARALERQAAAGDVRLDELALHFCEAAALGDVERAIHWSTAAAEAALARLAYEEAARYYERAVSALDPDVAAQRETACELRLALGRALRLAGEREASRVVALTAAGGARECSRPDLLADAAVVIGGDRGWSEAGVVDHELVALLEEALDVLPPEDSALRARSAARLATELYFLVAEADRRNTLTEDAVAMARRLDDRVTLALVLSCAIWGSWVPGNVAERLAMADEILDIALALGDRSLEVLAHTWSINCHAELGDRPGFDRAVAAEREVVDELRRKEDLWAVLVHEACQALVDADLGEAERLADEALTLGQSLSILTSVQMYGVHNLSLRRMRGGLEEVVPVVRAMVEEYPLVPAWRCGLALLYRDLGWLDDARGELEILAAGNFTDLPMDANWKVGVAIIAVVAATLGDAPRAEDLYPRLLPYADSMVTAGMPADVLGSMHLPLAMLAATVDRWDDAREHFEAAVAANDRFGVKEWSALAALRIRAGTREAHRHGRRPSDVGAEPRTRRNPRDDSHRWNGRHHRVGARWLTAHSMR